MSSPDLATVIIACPSCGTRYQVPAGALGDAGREVQCAQCGKSWRATAELPPPAPAEDVMFSPGQEDALDAVFEAEARAAAPPPEPAKPALTPEHQRTLDEIRAALAPKPRNANAIDPAALNQTQRAFDKRQQGLTRTLPMARMRRTARLGAFVALVSVLVLGFSLRTDLVTWFPQLAGLYAGIGLPVNVVGLQFEDAKTLTSLRDGKTVMQVTARIRSIANRAVDVPPILVSLLNAQGAPVYEWTVAPQTPSMDPGDIIDFTTEVNAPPEGAVTVRLSFTNPRGDTAPLETKAS